MATILEKFGFLIGFIFLSSFPLDKKKDGKIGAFMG